MTFLVNPYHFPPNVPIVQGAVLSGQVAGTFTVSPNALAAATLNTTAAAALVFTTASFATANIDIDSAATVQLQMLDAPKSLLAASASVMAMRGSAIGASAVDIDTAGVLLLSGAAIAAVPFSAVSATVLTGATGDPNALLKLRFEVDVTTDEGAFGYTWTNTGCVRTTTNPKFGVGCLEVDGTGDLMQSSTITQFEGSGPTGCCIEMWVRRTSAQSPNIQAHVTNSVGGIVIFFVSAIYTEGGDVDGRYAAASNGVGLFDIIVNGVQASVDNDWHHIAHSFDGSTYRLFWDGVLKDSTANATTPKGQNVPQTTIEVSPNGTIAFYDNFRLSNVARYTANFTPGDL